MDRECAYRGGPVGEEGGHSERRERIEKLLRRLPLRPDADVGSAVRSIEIVIDAVTDEKHWYNWEPPGKSSRQLKGIADRVSRLGPRASGELQRAAGIDAAAMADRLHAAAAAVVKDASFPRRLESALGRSPSRVVAGATAVHYRALTGETPTTTDPYEAGNNSPYHDLVRDVFALAGFDGWAYHSRETARELRRQTKARARAHDSVADASADAALNRAEALLATLASTVNGRIAMVLDSTGTLALHAEATERSREVKRCRKLAGAP